MIGCGRAAESQSVRQNARQRSPFYRLRHLSRIIPHKIMHDSGSAGQRAQSDINWSLGFKSACQFMMINNGVNIAELIFSGSSAGLFVSTMITGVLEVSSPKRAGFCKFHLFNTKAASVLGSPSSLASAGCP